MKRRFFRIDISRISLPYSIFRGEAAMRRLTPTLAVVMLAAAMHSARAQDVAAGKRAFGKCLPCHAIGEGAPIKLGPQLNGLDGRRAGTVPGYNYSAAMKKSGLTWNAETFGRFIKKPQGLIPGSKMFLPGIEDEQEIGNLWAYLKRFGADGKMK
jgi:cytochrome c